MPRPLPLLALVVGLFAVGCQRFQTRRELPPVPPAARSAAPDDTKPPLRDRLKEKREERRGTKEKEPPKLPSPVAPKADEEKKPGIEEKKQGADAPRSPESPADELAAVRKLYEAAARRYEALTDFEARMVRREVVKNRDTPQEELLFQYRKQPLSVYMKETVAKGIGKEVLYVQGRFENKMHVLIGTAEANFLMKVGSVQTFDPRNPVVTSRSRKRIDEAGFGDSLARFGKFIEQTAAGTRPNGVRYLGFVDRKEYPYPLEGIEAKLLQGDDPHLPRGGTKTAFFDMKQGSQGYGVPVVSVTLDETGREVEYYCFDRIRLPAGLTDADFHPDRLGKR